MKSTSKWVLLLATARLAGQESEFGLRCVEMSNAQRWEKVMTCEDGEQIRLRLDAMPVSVMASHAMVAIQTPRNEPGLGNLVIQILWVECTPDDRPGVFVSG